MPAPAKEVLTQQRRETIGDMLEYFDGQIDHNLAELYDVSSPLELRGRSLGDFEIAEDDVTREDSLRKVWFVAHARASTRTRFGVGGFVSSDADTSQDLIKARHRILEIPEVPRLFRIIPGAPDRNPFRQMLSRVRTAEGEPINHMKGGAKGTTYAGRILVGDVVLTDPDYDAIHPDPAFRELVTGLFLRSRS
jgi:hypothetical protein